MITVPNSFSQVVEGIDYSDNVGVYNTFDMTSTSSVGQRFPSEHLILKDSETGVDIIALTTSRHTNSKIYQTHPQWTPDGKYIVFSSNRTAGDGNRGDAYAISMENYEIVQVTDGDEARRLHLGWEKNVAYHFRDGQLIELNLGALLADSEDDNVVNPSNYETVIATLPDDIRPSGDFGLDKNEERIFFGSRIEDELYAIYKIDFQSGELTKLTELPFRVNHMQANRWVSGEIMYCWETGGDAPQRMWLLSVDDEGNVNNRPVYKEEPEEWVTHEVFVGPDHIMFNVMGHLERLREATTTGIFTKNTRTGEVKIHGQVDGGGYWHADGTPDMKWGVGDTFDGEIYRLDLENPEEYELLTTGHRPKGDGPFTGDAHSHHSISPDGKWILFNSSMLTDSDLMMIPLHPDGL